MIARDFGIRPFFLVNGWRDKERRLECFIDTKAYLLLPVDQGYWSPLVRNKLISQVSKHQIYLSLYKAMSRDQVGRFATAARILKLHENDKHEDESEYLIPRNRRIVELERDSCKAMAENISILMRDVITEKDPAWPGTQGAERTLSKETIQPRLMMFKCREDQATRFYYEEDADADDGDGDDGDGDE